MKNINELYLKISYKSTDTSMPFTSTSKFNWRDNIGKEKHRICGGMYSRNSGTIIFKVRDIEEAVDVVKKAYITGNDTYRYEINYKLLAV